MRSFFCASAIVLMAFSYIEISSGMDPRGRRKGKSVNPSDQNAASLGRDSKPKLNLKMVAVGKDQFQLCDEKTGELVGGVYHGKPAIDTESLKPRASSIFSEQRDVRGKLRKFDHELVRFEGDPPYRRGSAKLQHALAIQWNHIQNSQLALLNNQGTTLPQRTDQHASGLTAMQQYRNYKRTDGLLPEIPDPLGYETNFQRELRQNPLITTPCRRGISASGFNTNSFNPGEHNIWNQPAYNQHVSTLHQQQQPVAGFDPNFFNPGQQPWDPQYHQYANAINSGQAIYFHPNEGLPENTIFSESSHAHHLNQGLNWPYGTGHQK